MRFFIALAFVALLAGCGEKVNSDFIGQWKNNDGWIVTIEKVKPDLYRARIRNLFDMNVALIPESSNVLMHERTKHKLFELTSPTTMTSYYSGDPDPSFKKTK